MFMITFLYADWKICLNIFILLKNNVKVLLVEPLKCYYDNLPSNENAIKANYAVSNFNGSTEIYYIDPIDIEKYNLPNFLKGSNSIINKTAKTKYVATPITN